mmetsp:Transcript_12327/g.14863  ORF Transcript_12327/g.14863 Transcript_12327/m.14863 type:complete len:197 (-) Transcript_12327:72-662(-)|eukprot:CAMPEP_0195263692 /NCGR_PEP_ID=MMETSP0706-20130129/10448_1 /TAXON_ID=33640 /ORGANISM="Asterionellopsis glacialis, Strain CCMP134" /LENGTH=196 /DNA_ID=CAMNT_0040317905 /DNA_START=37 /DNA_END=627 /DNA_ORIENTATION=-
MVKIVGKCVALCLLVLPTGLAWGNKFRGGRGGRRRGGYGGGHGGGYGGGHGSSDTGTSSSTTTNSDHHDTIRRLMQNRHTISRSVVNTTDGVSTKTSSTKPDVAVWIKQHVDEMQILMKTGGRIRQWDPLFAAILDPEQGVTLNCTYTDDRVVHCDHSSSTECGIDLVQYHAEVVSNFIKYGGDEVWAEHEAPCGN